MKIWLTVSLTVATLLAATWGIFAQQASSGTRATNAGAYVENSILVDAGKSPKPQSLTIFHGGLVYDVPVKGTRIVIFDPQKEQLVLLDKVRKIKTEISTTKLEVAREHVRTWCLKQADSVLQFCGKPAFELDQSDRRIAFRASQMQYLVDTITPDDNRMADEYRKFSDAMVGLAVISQTSPIPPLARLAVNRELARRGVIPTSVAVEIRPKSAAVRHPIKIRSHHNIGWQLRQKDVDKLDEVLAYKRDFRRVDVNEFLARPATQAASR